MDEPVVGTSLWKDAWKRLRRNRLAVLGMVVVSFVIAASAVGPPDHSHSHRLHLRLHPERSRAAGVAAAIDRA